MTAVEFEGLGFADNIYEARSTIGLWQASLIALARSRRAKEYAQSQWMGSQIARRYVAGPAIDSLVEAAERLNNLGFLASAFYLGEYVDSTELVAKNVRQKLAVIEALSKRDLDVHVSVDPTQVGYQQSATIAQANLVRIAKKVAGHSAGRPGVHCLMLDMEDYSLVDATLHFHQALLAMRLPVAVTLQAYLRRSADDLRTLLRNNVHVRLVKGAYAMRGGPALAKQSEIKENYRRMVQLMLSRDARDAGFYPSIATHDSSIHELVLELKDRNGWQRNEFEFEMLLGVRPNIAASLVAGDARVRLYLPFGVDWWPYAARRLGESPAMAWLLLRSALRYTRKMGGGFDVEL